MGANVGQKPLNEVMMFLYSELLQTGMGEGLGILSLLFVVLVMIRYNKE